MFAREAALLHPAPPLRLSFPCAKSCPANTCTVLSLSPALPTLASPQANSNNCTTYARGVGGEGGLPEDSQSARPIPHAGRSGERSSRRGRIGHEVVEDSAARSTDQAKQ